jgi:hypothetical protein
MFKRIILTSALLAPLCAAAVTTYFPQGVGPQDLRTRQLLFGWDIHGVLVKKDHGELLGAILGNLGPLAVSKLTDDKSWNEIAKLKKEGDISGEVRAQILRKNGKKSAARAVEKASNAYKPRKGMQHIVTRLAAAGHEQRLASNIGPRFYTNLKTKLKKNRHGNTMFETIQLGKMVDADTLSGQPQTSGIDPRYLSPVPKPNAEFYNSFISAFNADGKKLPITIDDNEDNIKQAVKKGFVGIYFDTKRDNPAMDLLLELEKLGCFYPRK